MEARVGIEAAYIRECREREGPWRPLEAMRTIRGNSRQGTLRSFTLSAWEPGMLEDWLLTTQARICTKVVPSSPKLE